MKKVGIIMGSDSDLPVVEKAIKQLKELEIPFEVHVYSAHRTPELAAEFSKNAEDNGFGVIILIRKQMFSRYELVVKNERTKNYDKKNF